MSAFKVLILLNEKNVCNACMKYMKRKNVGGVDNDKKRI